MSMKSKASAILLVLVMGLGLMACNGALPPQAIIADISLS